VATYLVYQTQGILKDGHPLKKQNEDDKTWSSDAGDTSIGTPTNEDFSRYREIISTWCEQAFYRLFRRGMGVSIGTRLMVQSPDLATPSSFLRPGVTLEIRDREDDNVIIYFYVTEVIHTLDSQGKRALTNVLGNYVRPNEDLVYGEEAAAEEGGDGADEEGGEDGEGAAESFSITTEQLAEGLPNTLYDSRGELGAVREEEEDEEEAPAEGAEEA
jgi:hypothetical protein